MATNEKIAEPGFLDKRMNYFEGKEITVRNFIFIAAAILGGVFLVTNHEAILEFAMDLEMTIWLIFKSTLGVGAIWLITRPQLWRAGMILVDSTLRKMITAIKYRDPVSAAQYDLSLFKRTVDTFVDAKDEVGAAKDELGQIAEEVKEKITSNFKEAHNLNTYMQTEMAAGRLQSGTPEFVQLEGTLSDTTYAWESARTELEDLIPDLTVMSQNLTALETYHSMLLRQVKQHETEIEGLARRLRAESSRERGMRAADSLLQGRASAEVRDSMNMIRQKIARSRAVADSISRRLEPGAVQFELSERLKRMGSVNTFQQALTEGGEESRKVAGVLDAPKEVIGINDFLRQFQPGYTPAQKVAAQSVRQITEAKSLLD